jgi:predicted DNA-binding protein with PD1-like motif
MEVVNFTGNVALVEGEQFLHVHVVLSDTDNRAHGGHLKEAEVAVTLEVFLSDFQTEIERVYDEETGLKLFNLS